MRNLCRGRLLERLRKTNTGITNETAVNVAKSVGASTNTNKNSIGLLYGIYGGYGLALDDHYYVGSELSVLSDTVSRSMNTNANDAGSGATYSTATNYKRGIAFGASPRFGYVFGDNMIYVKPGVEMSRDKATATYSVTAAGSSSQSGTVSSNKTNIALTPAVGYEKALGPLLLRTEYTYNKGKKIGINSNNTPATDLANVSYKDHRFAIGAAYKF